MKELEELVLAWDGISQDATLRLLPWLAVQPSLGPRLLRMRLALVSARAAIERGTPA